MDFRCPVLTRILSSLARIPHPHYLTKFFIIPTIPLVVSDYPGLPSTRTLLGLAIYLIFPLSNFPSTNQLPGYKFLIFLVVFKAEFFCILKSHSLYHVGPKDNLFFIILTIMQLWFSLTLVTGTELNRPFSARFSENLARC